MQRLNKDSQIQEIDFNLDITGEVCPLTFVKTKLLIERMAPGQIAEIRLKGAEPLENVPRSLKELGHTIISLKAETPNAETPNTGIGGVHRLRVRKEQ